MPYPRCRIESLNCACDVVERDVVRVAVSEVGLVTNRDLGLDLIADSIVVTVRGMLNGDVGVDRIEVLNSGIEDLLKSSTHLMIEGDGYGLCCVEALCGDNDVVVSCRTAVNVYVYVAYVTARHSANAEAEHQNESDDGRNDSFHDRL